MKPFKNNHRGQIFVVSVIMAVTIALIAAAVILHSLFKETNPDQFLGSYQSAIVDSMNDGDRILLYMDEASKMSVASAFDDYLYGNPNPLTNVEGGDPESKYCGSYVYRLWNTLKEDCYPDYKSTDFELNALITKHFLDLTRNIKPSSSYPNEEQYFDTLIKQNINFRYSYTPIAGYTNIVASSDDQYTVNIFKNKETAIDSGIQTYLRYKSAYTGSLIWPLANNFDVASCFGYRGIVDTKSGIQASQNHPGLDIGAPRDTPVLAAAPGTIVLVLYPAWGKVVIDHGGGLKTGYIHMNSIAPGIQVGSIVNQGDVIGYVGGRGPNSENDYDNHLHFEVTSSTVNLDANYKGVNGVSIDGVISTVNGNYVNPMCFIDQSTIQGKITFSTSTSCTSICSSDKVCAKSDPNDEANSPPYKFCSVYEGVLSVKPACVKTEKTDWNIQKIGLSSTELTSDQTLTISITIENKEATCVAVTPKITISDANLNQYSQDNMHVFSGKETNIYQSTDTSKYTTFDAFSCSFTNDEAIAKKGIENGDCVLLFPDDATEISYRIYPEITDYNGDTKSPNPKYLEFKVKKGTSKTSVTTTNTVNNNFQSSISALSNSEKAKLQKTEDNLNSLGIMDYIAEQSQKEGVPKELVLGLITTESSGELGVVSPTGAYGLFQVIKSYHEKRAIDECGSWNNFIGDAQCQVRVGIGILKAYHDQYGTKGIDFKCSCDGNQGTVNCKDMDVKYVDWDAAIRAYNSADCTSPSSKKWADYNFVDTVLKYASGWGYIGTTDTQVKDEMYVGILGKYFVDPRFNVKMDFDMSLLDMLKKFATDAVKNCGVEGTNKEDCIKDKVKSFNENLPQQYKDMATLSTTCDTSDSMTEVNKFVEEVNDCMSSQDDACQCVFSNADSNMEMQSIQSVDGSTKLSYYSNNKIVDAYFDYSIMKDKKFLSTSDSTWLSSINLYKNNSRLISDYTGDRNCSNVKSAYRLCLVTKYWYDVYDAATQAGSGNIQEKYVTIPFAIMVRDNVAPKPVNSIESQAMPHSRDSIILKWKAGAEGDITRYNIYMSDSEADFTQPTATFKKTLKYKSVSIINSKTKSYLEYKSIDFTNPICVLTEDTTGIKYCKFNYTAVDTDGKTVSIELMTEKLYYMSDEKKFVYILDGNDKNNNLASGTAKFIAITAVDMDGNEINNIDSGQQISYESNNLISVTPADNLEPGFVNIISQGISPDKKVLMLSWDAVKNYIDGTTMTDSAKINYDIHIEDDSCESGKLNDVSASSQSVSTPNTDLPITLQQSDTGPPLDYCVYVLANLDSKKFLKGYSVNTRDIQMGVPPTLVQ